MKHILALILTFISVHCYSQVAIPVWADSIQKRVKFKTSFIKQNIIGNWKDQNSTTTFFKTGKYSTWYNERQTRENGSWEIKSNKLIFYEDGFLGIGIVYNIRYFSSDTYIIQSTSSRDTTLWITNRIK